MPRRQIRSDPSRLLPILARAFADLGYRTATTAELARRCGVRENILYRAWPDKKCMFVAAIEHVHSGSIEVWSQLLAGADGKRRKLLEYEAVHHGERGLHRIVFAALGEIDDAEIRAALRRLYEAFHDFLLERLLGGAHATPEQRNRAWALIGLGTVSNIVRELGMLDEPHRKRLFLQIGDILLGGAAPPELGTRSDRKSKSVKAPPGASGVTHGRRPAKSNRPSSPSTRSLT